MTLSKKNIEKPEGQKITKISYDEQWFQKIKEGFYKECILEKNLKNMIYL